MLPADPGTWDAPQLIRVAGDAAGNFTTWRLYNLDPVELLQYIQGRDRGCIRENEPGTCCNGFWRVTSTDTKKTHYIEETLFCIKKYKKVLT